MQTQNEQALIVEQIVPDSANIHLLDHLLTYDGQLLPSSAALMVLEVNIFGKESILLAVKRNGHCLDIAVSPGRWLYPFPRCY